MFLHCISVITWILFLGEVGGEEFGDISDILSGCTIEVK
jgi:hypothetical protein